jgi:hypothetical protein
LLTQLLAYGIGVLAPAIGLIGGLWAVNRLRSPEMRARPDRRTALRLVGIVAILATLAATVLVAELSTMFSSNSPNYVTALPYGLGFGAFVGLAAILGYVLFAGRGRSGATAAVLAGPVILIAATILGAVGSTAFQQASFASDEDQHQQATADRSTKVHASVEQLEVQTTTGGKVAGVNLSVTLSTDVALQFDASAKEPDPRFRLLPPDSSATLDAAAPPGSPTTIDAQASHAYVLAFNYPEEILNATAGTEVPGSPGTWILEITFADPAVGEYLVRIPVEVR